jgi:hypothetical protein
LSIISANVAPALYANVAYEEVLWLVLEGLRQVFGEVGLRRVAAAFVGRGLMIGFAPLLLMLYLRPLAVSDLHRGCC